MCTSRLAQTISYQQKILQIFSKKFNKKRTIFCSHFFLFFLFFSHDLHAFKEHVSLFEYIAQENLQTLTSLTLDTDQTHQNSLHEYFKREKHFYEILEETLKEHQTLPPLERRRLILSIFAKHDVNTLSQQKTHESTVLDIKSWQDLEILAGNYLAQKINRTTTEAGTVLLLKALVSPTTDIPYLKTQQDIIRELFENQTLTTELTKYIHVLKKHEDTLFSFWQDDIFLNLLKQNAYHFPHAPKLSHWANRAPFIIELGNITEFTGIIAGNAALLAAGIMLPIVGIAQLSNSPHFEKLDTRAKKWGLHGLSYFSLTGATFLLLQNIYKSKNIEATASILSGSMGGLNVLHFGNWIKATITLKRCVQIKLMACAHYIKTLKQIAKITKNNPVLAQNFHEITELDTQLKIIAQESKELKQLLNLLETNTFSGSPSFFSSWGRLYVAYCLLSYHKERLVPLIITAGKLDMYLSCAQLMREAETRENKFCFVQFSQHTEKSITEKNSDFSPYVQATNFWNPGVNHTKAVTNSITIGNNPDTNNITAQIPSNIIVSGPNGGGKSTITKALVINSILAQVWGIAAAQEWIMTPFSKIMTYLNITDDIAHGVSLFQAGVLRAREIFLTVKNLPKHCLSLTAIDEIFNGTSHEEGQAAACAFLEALAKFSHNMCLTISHYQKIPLLAKKTHLFTNYMVNVSKDSSGAIIYDFKLYPGTSHHIIALDILKEAGFDATFLTTAQEILHE